MPIITKTDGWTKVETVVAVGPDRDSAVLIGGESVPENLDPLKNQQLNDWNIMFTEDKPEEIIFDYSGVNPEQMEQVIVVTGAELYRKPFRVGSDGYGGTLGLKPIPQPEHQRYYLRSLSSIRPDGMYSRKRKAGPNSEVVGWELSRKYKQGSCKER